MRIGRNGPAAAAACWLSAEPSARHSPIGCHSWYLDADDLPTAWPWTYDRFREEMRTPRLADYEMR